MEETNFMTVGELNDKFNKEVRKATNNTVYVRKDEDALASKKQLSFFTVDDLKALGSVKSFGVIPEKKITALTVVDENGDPKMDSQMAMTLSFTPSNKSENEKRN